MRSRPYLAWLLTFLVVGGVLAASGSLSASDDDPLTAWEVPRVAEAPVPDLPAPSPTATPSPGPDRPALDLSAEVDVDIDGFLYWAALNRHTGQRAGSADRSATSTTESMIKVWIVADYLRRLAENGEEPTEQARSDTSRAIRESHNGAAQRLYQAGGSDDVVARMIGICGLTDTGIYPAWWSRTQISARDAVRLGECVADGRAAGPEWTDWLLDEMREVQGTTADRDQPMDGGGEGGRWGIIDGLPSQVRDQGVAIKNGWTRIGRTGNWHLACLAITDDWVMSVLMQYPAERSLEYGAQRCAAVAEQLVPG